MASTSLWAGLGARNGCCAIRSPASERTRGLGADPAVGLKDARERAGEARKLVTRGIDPIEADRAARNAAKPIPTFGEIAERVIEDAVGKSVSAKARHQWERYLGDAYCKKLLDRPIHEITAVDVAATLRIVWKAKPESARKLYPAIRRVFDRARVILRDEHGIAMPDNPARWDDLKAMGFENAEGTHEGQSSFPASWADARIHRCASEEKCDGRARPRIADPDQCSDECHPSGQMARVRSRQGALECPAGQSEGPRAPEGVVRSPAIL
jgi:Arm DNA-binding domain